MECFQKFVVENGQVPYLMCFSTYGYIYTHLYFSSNAIITLNFLANNPIHLVMGKP